MQHIPEVSLTRLTMSARFGIRHEFFKAAAVGCCCCCCCSWVNVKVTQTVGRLRCNPVCFT